MNLILGISNEIKWKVKVVLLEGSFMNFILGDFQGYQMVFESGVTRSVVHETHSLDIQRYQMEG